MHTSMANTGRQLASVALRYRQRLGGFPERWASASRRRPAAGWMGGREWPSGGEVAARWAELTRLEAVLFLSCEPLGSRKLAQLAGLADGTKARTLVRSLNRQYDTQKCAFRVEEVAGGFQLLTRPKFAPWLRRLHDVPAEARLSAPALETLAVVAYRQPVLRADIEAIRGVQCGEILRQLIERDLVRTVGRSTELGRPFLYGTTRHFLQIFGLRHLEELPRPDWLQNAQPATEQDAAEADIQSPTKNQNPHVPEEEVNVTIANATNLLLERFTQHGATPAIESDRDQPGFTPCELANADEDDDFEDDDDEDDDDDDLEDEEWEEVEDEDEDEEEEEEEEEEDWEDEDEDEDWDDDWEDEDEEEEEEEEKKE